VVEILNPTHYKAVREALDISLDDDSLPDDVISSGVFLGAAENEIARRYPLADPDDPHVILGAILLTAANLAPSIPRVVRSSTVTAVSLQVDQPRWNEIAALLRARALDELSSVVGTVVVVPPVVFTLGHGDRGRLI
jgi:hypothetical protein